MCRFLSQMKNNVLLNANGIKNCKLNLFQKERRKRRNPFSTSVARRTSWKLLADAGLASSLECKHQYNRKIKHTKMRFQNSNYLLKNWWNLVNVTVRDTMMIVYLCLTPRLKISSLQRSGHKRQDLFICQAKVSVIFLPRANLFQQEIPLLFQHSAHSSRLLLVPALSRNWSWRPEVYPLIWFRPKENQA